MTDKIWPIEFAENENIWASNGMFYPRHDDIKWWNLPSPEAARALGAKVEKTQSYINSIYFVIGITDEHCFVKNTKDSNRIMYRNHGSGWNMASWSLEEIHKKSIFIPGEKTVAPESVSPIVATKPRHVRLPDNWFKVDGGCYFCGPITDCPHLERLF